MAYNPWFYTPYVLYIVCIFELEISNQVLHMRLGSKLTFLMDCTDVRTQAMYQLLEAGFIGLIFSCFSEDAQKVRLSQLYLFAT